jgi:RNA polymerase sigma factor (sigma-70 family)
MFKFTDSEVFLRRFKDGDRVALEEVYLAYVDEVEMCVRRFLSFGVRFGWSRVDASDLVQEVFLRAFGEKGRTSFDGRRDYGPFLGAVTRNLLVDWARRHGREVVSDQLDQLPDASKVEATEWAEPDTMAAVNEYIDELPDDLRAIHELRYVHCQSQDQTCAVLGISRQHLRTREKHLCDGLRRKLSRLDLIAWPAARAAGGLPAP